MNGDLLRKVENLGYPHLLLITLVITIGFVGLLAASTSTAGFGAFNTEWDGAAGLRDEARATGAEPVTTLNTSTYKSVDPDRTIAVVLAPNESYSAAEAQHVRQFVEGGGTLIVAEDFGEAGNTLLGDVGAVSRFDGRLLRDEKNYYRSPAMPVATNVTTGPQTEGVDQLTLNHGTVLGTNASNPNVTVLVRSSEFAYLDSNANGALDEEEELRERPVVVREQVGEGTVYAVSDPSLFINVMLDRPGNGQFARNLFAAHETVLLDYSHRSGQPPLAVLLLTVRDLPWLQALIGLGAIVVVIRWDVFSRAVRSVTGEREERSRVSPVDDDALITYLERKHPEWDEDRIRKIMRGILSRREEQADDE